MHFPRASVLFLMFLFAGSAVVPAQLPRSQASLDGFVGPVRSVASGSVNMHIHWTQPGGPTLVTPLRCRDCEYDRDGTRTKFGQTVEGKFFGQNILLSHDGSGTVTERFVTDAGTGALQEYDVMGPFGRLQQTTFINGKPEWKSLFAYDASGNMSEWRSFHWGKLEGHTKILTDASGNLLDRSVYRKNGQLSWQHTFDPETSIERFSSYDESGKVILTYTVREGKLVSFWEPSDSPHQFGDNFTEKVEEGTYENYACHNDLKCDLSRIHYEYQNHDKHTPTSAEWRDADGNLQLAAYFQYQLDSYGNWTQRQVWVWNPSLGDSTLFETDFRAITYWSK